MLYVVLQVSTNVVGGLFDLMQLSEWFGAFSVPGAHARPSTYLPRQTGSIDAYYTIVPISKVQWYSYRTKMADIQPALPYDIVVKT